MKKINKVFVTALSCLLAATYVMPISAEDEVEKSESVYTVLNADGSVKTITVSDTLHSDSGFNNYKDTSDLKDVENLKSNDEVNSTSGGYIWNTSDTDIYYQGTSSKELPLTVKITYTLDGKEISSDDLVGQSGHLVIKVNVTNSSKQTYTANNKTYNLVTPFVTGLVCMMDDDTFTNVEVNSGTVTSDSSHSIIASVMVPGLKSGLKQVLDTDLMHKLEDYLIDEITIEADVTDYESPTLMMAAATSTDKLKEEFDDVDDFSSIFDKLDELKEATQELIDGTTSLYDGAVKLNDGVGTLKDGASSLSSGATSLYDGADKLASGATNLRDGLNKLSSSSSELRGGMNKLADTVLDTANAQLEEAGFPGVTWDDIEKCKSGKVGECVFDKYSSVTVTDEQRAAAKAEITELVKAKVGNRNDLDKLVNALIYMAAQNADSSLSLEEKITAASTKLLTAQQLASSDAYKNAVEYVGALTNTTTPFDFSDSNHAVNKVLAGIREQKSLNPSDDDLKGAYATILTNIKAAVKSIASRDIDDTTAGLILAYACKNVVDSDVLGTKNLGNAINNVLSEQNAYACDDPYNDAVVSQVVKAAYTSSVMATGLDIIYKTCISDLVNALAEKGQDDTTTQTSAVTIFAYAVAKHDGVYDINSYTPTLYFNEYAGDLTTMQEANNAINEANDSANEKAQAYITNALTAAVQSEINDSMTSVKKQLVDLKTLRDGVTSYTNGVDTVASGSKTLVDGLGTLVSGTKQLREGIDTLNSGVATLKDGSQTLADGAKTLKEGMQKYNDEAISKLTESTRITSLQEASNLLTAMTESKDNYNNYSGISDGTEGSIKFVFKIEGSQKKKSDETTSETTTEKVSFWQRILNLFKH